MEKRVGKYIMIFWSSVRKYVGEGGVLEIGVGLWIIILL